MNSPTTLSASSPTPTYMSEDHKRQLETQLWNIANDLRGNMDAAGFRDYILGFIFYKYLSEKMYLYANGLLEAEDITDFTQIDENSKAGKEVVDAIREEALGRLGYFLLPSELFSSVAIKGAKQTDNFILQELADVLKHIEASTQGTDSEEDFEALFEEIDLYFPQEVSQF